MNRNARFATFFIFFLLAIPFIHTGCRLFDPSSSESEESTDSVANANVQFQILLPGPLLGKQIPLASIKGSTASPTILTFTLVLVNPGNTAEPTTTLTQTGTVDASGSVQVSFPSIPSGTIIGRITVSDGYLSGWTDFQGAMDVQAGNNTLEVAPAGSGLLPDLLAFVVQATIQSSDLLENAPPLLVGFILTAVQTGATASDTNQIVFERFVELIQPASSVHLSLSSDHTKILASIDGIQKWEKATADVWTSTELWGTTLASVKPKMVLRQALDGYAYIGWQHDSENIFGISRQAASDGARLAICRNPGPCGPALSLPAGSIVIGGINAAKGCPVLFHWSGSEEGSTFSTAGPESGLIWARYFPEFPTQSSVSGTGVESIQYDGNQTLLVGVRDGINNVIRNFRIDLQTGLGNVQGTGTLTNASPTISLTRYPEQAEVLTGTNVTLSAIAADIDGSIARVEFFEGTSLIGEDTEAPFTAVWNAATPGAYSFWARATDDKGAVATSTNLLLEASSSALPASPTNLTATFDSGTVALSWDEIPGASGYNIYFSTTTGVTRQTGTKTTSVTPTLMQPNLTRGVTYYFVATAVALSGESSESAEIAVTTNTLPTSSNSVVSTVEDTNKIFGSADFSINDLDNDPLSAVMFTALPSTANGVLQYSTDGLNWTNVSETTEISITTIDSSELRFCPTLNKWSDSGPTTAQFKVYDGFAWSLVTSTMSIYIATGNDAPGASDNTLTGAEDTTLALATTDFGFTDIDAGDSLVSVKITSLESVGILKLDGVDVTLDQIITATDILAGKLTFDPLANDNGYAYDSFRFTVNDGTDDSQASYEMTISLTAVNDAPTVPWPSAIEGMEDAPLVLNSWNFNFQDIDNGDSLASIMITELPATGTLEFSSDGVNWENTTQNMEIPVTDIDAGKLRFSPAANGFGDPYATFFYKVSDGTAWSTDASIFYISIYNTQDTPLAANGTVTTSLNTPYVFTYADFHFNSLDERPMTVIQFPDSLTAAGTMQYSADGVIWADLPDDGHNYTKSDIDLGRIRFVPALGESGSPYTDIEFMVSDGWWSDWQLDYHISIVVTP